MSKRCTVCSNRAHFVCRICKNVAYCKTCVPAKSVGEPYRWDKIDLNEDEAENLQPSLKAGKGVYYYPSANVVVKVFARMPERDQEHAFLLKAHSIEAAPAVYNKGYNQANGLYYFVMEYLDNTKLVSLHQLYEGKLLSNYTTKQQRALKIQMIDLILKKLYLLYTTHNPFAPELREYTDLAKNHKNVSVRIEPKTFTVTQVIFWEDGIFKDVVRHPNAEAAMRAMIILYNNKKRSIFSGLRNYAEGVLQNLLMGRDDDEVEILQKILTYKEAQKE